MQIAFDPLKDIANQRKHGLSLADASLMDMDAAVVFPDTRTDYGESRSIAFGLIRGRLHVMVFTARGSWVRVI
jgi:uncharacterized DUF497 family protein